MCGFVCMYVCVFTPEALITSGVVCTLYYWLNKFYSFYMAAVVVISSRHSLSIEVYHRFCDKNHPNKNELVLYKPLVSVY